MQSDTQTRADSISFRQLKLFESIGRLKSVRKASDECNLSQPAVTQALAKLEQQVGHTMVDRRASGSYLNDFGDVFHVRVVRFFDHVEQALTDLGVDGEPGTVKAVVKRMSRTQVRTLIGIVENGSFGDAADALALSQTSLQRAVRDLESNLRKPLFYRTAAGTMITPEGIEFGRRMKLALQEVEWGIRELDAMAGGFNSQIVIGAMPFGGSVLLASVLDGFLHAHPNADVQIANGNASQMLKSLRAGDVDIVVGLLPDALDVDLVSEAVAQTPYSIVARRGHPLLRKGQITTADLLSYEWVVGNEGASRRACFEQMFAGGVRPRVPITTCAFPVIRHLLAQSDRLTLMTSYELVHEGDNLHALPFGAIDPVPTIGIMMRSNWMPTSLHTNFIRIMRWHAAKASTRPVLTQAG